METLEHWSGPEGDAYTERQTLSMDTRRDMYLRVLERTDGVRGIIEFGANDGSNLKALRAIHPGMILAGVEINETAFDRMKTVADFAFRGSMLDELGVGKWDMSMTRGVLIHIAPDDLPKAYAALYNASSRWICIAEYFSTKLEAIPYRGQMGLLWKGPHAYDMMDRYPDLKLVDYGFVSSRDVAFPQDDLNWWLMSKV